MSDESELEKTEEQLTAEENIKKLKEEALEKRRQGDAAAGLDIGSLIPLVFQFLGISPPGLEEAIENIAILFLGEPTVEKAKAAGPDELKKLVDPLIENIMLLAMTAVSMASAGLVPPPSIPVIKKVFEIIRDFESAASSQAGNGESETVNIN